MARIGVTYFGTFAIADRARGYAGAPEEFLKVPA